MKYIDENSEISIEAQFAYQLKELHIKSQNEKIKMEKEKRKTIRENNRLMKLKNYRFKMYLKHNSSCQEIYDKIKHLTKLL
jgi:hypothetical protein